VDFFDMGDRYPVLDKHNESTIPNLFIVGDVAGTPDIKAALNAGHEAAHLVGKRFPQTPAGAEYTVAILGAGPAGVNAAMNAGSWGFHTWCLNGRKYSRRLKYSRTISRCIPVDGRSSRSGDFPFQETTASALLNLWSPLVKDMQLNIHEHEEVKGLRKKGCFVITTSSREYLAASVIVAAGKLTFLAKAWTGCRI